MTEPATLTGPAPQDAALSRELSEFLIELSIGVHRYAMYPPDHPSLEPVVERLIGSLGELFQTRRTLAIGVAHRQLVIEGVATEEKHPVLSDLARRLHDHQLGAITFDIGITASEMGRVLATLAQETERGGTPLGLRPAEEFPEWPHAKLYRVGYERLEIRGAEGHAPEGLDQAAHLWLGLAQAALATELAPDEVPSPSAVARSIRSHEREAAYDQVIVGYLRQLATELRSGRGGEAVKVRRRVSALVNELDEETLTRLVGLGGNPAQRKQFLLDASQGLAVDSVIKMLQAAARSQQQTISHSMTRLLTKLATHAEQGEGPVKSQADTALRENVERLIEDWQLSDPNPERYTRVLDAMARAAPVFQAPAPGQEQLSGSERIVQMALELDAWGPLVEGAVEELATSAGGPGKLLAALEAAPDAGRVASAIRERLTSPEQFRSLLAAGNVDDDALSVLVQEMGESAVEPLLDVLAESDSRSLRRRVFDVLAGFGGIVGERAVRRLGDPRWFVLRNMLALLQRLDAVPDDFDVEPFLTHADGRVRREAFPLALASPGLRERALVLALSDDDERMVRMALLEIREAVPEHVVPTLAKRVARNPARSPEIRALGAKVLGASASSLARRTLLEMAVSGRSLLGRARFDPEAPEALAALRALATGWADDPEAQPVLERAGKSRDPRVRGAVRIVTVREDPRTATEEDPA